MFALLSKVTKDVLTEKDGASYDVTKVQWIIGTLVFFGLSIYSMVTSTDHHFDPVAWGIGFGSVLAAGSAGVKIKESTEQPIPPPTPPTDK